MANAKQTGARLARPSGGGRFGTCMVFQPRSSYNARNSIY